MNRLKRFFQFRRLALIGVASWVSVAAAAAEKVVVTRTSLPTSKIERLLWLGDELEVQHNKARDSTGLYVVLKGRYPNLEFDLYAHNRLVTRAASGAFEIKVAVKEKPVHLSMKSIGPDGEIETEEVLLLKIAKEPKR